MIYPKHNDKNIKILIRDIVDSWDTPTLIEFALDELYQMYLKSSKDFRIDASARYEIGNKLVETFGQSELEDLDDPS